MTDNELSEATDKLAEYTRRSREVARTTPWEHPEPLKAWEAFGLSCIVLNGPGSINGYVQVPEGHPFHGVLYSECPRDCDDEWCDHRPDSVIEVHGGITFSNLGKDGWWFGFDTNHCGDYNAGSLYQSGGRVWSIDAVASETESMAEQLSKAEPTP